MKFGCIVSDNPWFFQDKLTMSKTKRGAESQYSVLSDQDIINLPVKDIADNDSVLVNWVPGSKLEAGMNCCKNWGFNVVQDFVWVKTKKDPLKPLLKQILKTIKTEDPKEFNSIITAKFDEFVLDDILAFYMGHCFRQTHEICLVGTRGKYTKLLKNKSQRSVCLGPIGKHSEKPEALQDRLDIMFPDVRKCELFARRIRPGWECIGNESPQTLGEDIRISLEKLK
jgi:N6-adenosine-specific RNA methylase IME4